MTLFRWKRLVKTVVFILAALMAYASQGQSPGLLGESQNGDGVVGRTEAVDKSGVYGFSPRGVGVTGRSEEQPGVVGWTSAADASGVIGHSPEGVGVRGRSDSNNGVVGWSGSNSHSGVFGYSGPGIGVTGMSGDNDGVLAVTSSPNVGHAGLRARNEGGGPAVVVEGDLFVTGAVRGDKGPNGGASFPQPAFVSEWQGIRFSGVVLVGSNGSVKINHNIGGNPENYVVDLQFRGSRLGLHNRQHGGGNFVKAAQRKNNISNGGWWSHLDGQSITVWKGWSDKEIDEVRVRIWTYM